MKETLFILLYSLCCIFSKNMLTRPYFTGPDNRFLFCFIHFADKFARVSFMLAFLLAFLFYSSAFAHVSYSVDVFFILSTCFYSKGGAAVKNAGVSKKPLFPSPRSVWSSFSNLVCSPSSELQNGSLVPCPNSCLVSCLVSCPVSCPVLCLAPSPCPKGSSPSGRLIPRHFAVDAPPFSTCRRQ